ncbi:WGxxGxxG family protein [Amycolatopsis sp. cmx-11-51]|uniref:WGxxGxxG family protein n=1 Tax=unclassified Amycolatopsis TaxID=2618356 RepID=UPI0039E4E87A
MKRGLRISTCACAASVALLLSGGGTVSAVAAPSPVTPISQQVDDDRDGNGSSRDDRVDGDGNNGLWGLLGLVGLLGLAGLARRGPKAGAMTGYPGAGSDAPPVNTYPPAEPRRHPPGV